MTDPEVGRQYRREILGAQRGGAGGRAAAPVPRPRAVERRVPAAAGAQPGLKEMRVADWITIAGDSSTGRATITARGAFSWTEAVDVLTNFGPTSRHGRSGASPLRMTFALDRTFEPVGVAITPTADGLEVEVAGTRDVEAAARQVARIFSLDHDGEGYEQLGRRDEAFGRLQAAKPGLRPVCFTSPYECAAWAIMSQRISMRQAAAIQDRLIAEHGHPIVVAGETVRAFPSPERLAAGSRASRPRRSSASTPLPRLRSTACSTSSGSAPSATRRDRRPCWRSAASARSGRPGSTFAAAASSTSSRTSRSRSPRWARCTASAIGRRPPRSGRSATSTGRTGCGPASCCAWPRAAA